ncbi:MAG: DNA polymerase III subunit delta' [Actinomycetota bacterium]
MFNEIIGQEKALGLIESALASGNVSHAYLFTGPRGVGKTMAAVRAAMTLNCSQGGCGVCASCLKIMKGAHPDVVIVEAEGNVLKIDQIRTIGKSIGLKPFEGKRKVYIIRNVETMNAESGNALLRNLEEPPSYVTFILTAAGADGLLPTIVSRCQEVPFGGVPAADIKALLVTGFGITEEKAEILASLSAGSVAKALGLSETGEESGTRDYVLDNAAALRTGDILQVFAMKDEIMKMVKSRDKRDTGPATSEVIDILTSWYRDMLVMKETGDQTLLVNKDRASAINELAGTYGRDELTNALDVLTGAAGAMRTNANKELLLEYALLAISGG